MAKAGEVKEFTEKKVEEETKDFKGSGIEGKKGNDEKSYITGEDVIKKMREQGKKI